MPQQKADNGATKDYVLDKSSASTEVMVDNKTLTRSGKPVALTQDQYDRASALEGVKLVEASEASSEE
jgi:hypothetical protein